MAGYLVSFIALGAGWAWAAYVLRHSPEAGRGLRIALLVGAVLCVAPLPARFAVLAVAVSLLVARTRTA